MNIFTTEGLPRREAFFVTLRRNWLAAALGTAAALAAVMRFSWDLAPQTLLHAGFIALLVLTVFRYRLRFSWRREGIILIAGFAALLSIVNAPEKATARNELLVFFDALAALWLTGLLTEGQKRNLLMIPVFAGLWLSVILLYYFIKAPAQFLLHSAFPIDFLVNFNVIAGCLTLALPLSFLMRDPGSRLHYRHYYILSLVILAGILLTRSRSAITAAGLIIVAELAARSRSRLKLLAGAAAIGLLIVSVLILAKPGFLLSATDRIGWMRAALAMFFDHPFIGGGWGSFGNLYTAYRTVPVTGTLYAHNLPLQLLAESGLFGTTAFALLLIAFFRNSRLRPATLAVAGFLLINLFDYGFYIPALMIITGLCLGTAFSVEALPRERRLVHPAVAALVIAAGIAVLSLPLAASIAYQRALHVALRGNPERAIDGFRIASIIDPLAAAPHERLSEIFLADYTQNHDPADLKAAVAEQIEALARFPSNARGWADLAWLFRLQGRTEAARRALVRAVINDPLNPRYTVQLRALGLPENR